MGDRLRALLIEDSPIILENLQQMLEELGTVEVVGTAACEADARAWMEKRTDACDVAIIDMFLESGSGLGVLKYMADFSPPPERVVLTNYATLNMRARCRSLGVEAVFDKSTEIEGLVEWLESRIRH